MISREFLLWLESDWRRAITMALIAALMGFMLVVSVLLSFRHSRIQELQLQRLEEIESEARTARMIADKNRAEVTRNKQEIRQLEQAVKEDH
jgi:hypothetical protein